MIFLTVGTQLPFDRLTQAVDAWAYENPGVEIFGQIANTEPESFTPKNFEWKSFVEPDEFQEKYEQAGLVVAHAGMGSIISALTHQKSIIIMPRLARFKEHRNDHQLATVDKFRSKSGVYVVEDEKEIHSALTKNIESSDNAQNLAVSDFADVKLTTALQNFIHDT